jgi:pyruvate kinase
VPEVDPEHLRFGEKIGVDLVALSFVRRADDITAVRAHTRLPLIAKIETPQAVQRIEEIVRAADCAMVARGDLGIELPIEDVPIVKRADPRASRRARAPVEHSDPDARLDGRLPAPGRSARLISAHPPRWPSKRSRPGGRPCAAAG